MLFKGGLSELGEIPAFKPKKDYIRSDHGQKLLTVRHTPGARDTTGRMPTAAGDCNPDWAALF